MNGVGGGAASASLPFQLRHQHTLQQQHEQPAATATNPGPRQQKGTPGRQTYKSCDFCAKRKRKCDGKLPRCRYFCYPLWFCHRRYSIYVVTPVSGLKIDSAVCRVPCVIFAQPRQIHRGGGDFLLPSDQVLIDGRTGKEVVGVVGISINVHQWYSQEFRGTSSVQLGADRPPNMCGREQSSCRA